MKDLWRIQYRQRRPAKRVRTLEEEHDRHGCINTAGVGRLTIQLVQSPEEKQKYGKQCCRDQCHALSSYLVQEASSNQGNDQTPGIHDDVLQTISQQGCSPSVYRGAYNFELRRRIGNTCSIQHGTKIVGNNVVACVVFSIS